MRVLGPPTDVAAITCETVSRDRKQDMTSTPENDSLMMFLFKTLVVALSGTVINIQGPLSFQVKLEDGRIVRRHIDHVHA